jgi:hypothetical protein
MVLGAAHARIAFNWRFCRGFARQESLLRWAATHTFVEHSMTKAPDEASARRRAVPAPALQFLAVHFLVFYGAITLLDELFAPRLHWRPTSMISRVLVAIVLAVLARIRRMRTATAR